MLVVSEEERGGSEFVCVCKLIKRNENHNRKRTDRSKNRQEGREIRVADTKTETETEAEAEDELVKLRRNDAEWNGIDYINCRWRADCLHENETQRRLGYELQKKKEREGMRQKKARQGKDKRRQEREGKEERRAVRRERKEAKGGRSLQ